MSETGRLLKQFPKKNLFSNRKTIKMDVPLGFKQSRKNTQESKTILAQPHTWESESCVRGLSPPAMS